MAFTAGEIIGPYRIVEQIGQGGMATVYKALHANLDRYVAFKVLHQAFKEDPNFLERFKREAQIVAHLEHPHIVPVYDFATHAEQPYLVMKFIEGETLKARLKRQPFTLDETLTMMDSVAAALTYAHEQGILHRDIKPSNIMLDAKNTPYIADFGLARMAQAGESTLSQDMMLGTPQYISPEQAKGIYDLGPGTDIYSLGVVLYEILVGCVPFNADTPYAIVHDHIYKVLPLPSKINPQVPPQVEHVLLRALEKEPAGRFASAVEMINALRQAVVDAGLTELSAARYRPAEVVSSTAETAPPETVSPAPTPVFTGIPAPIPTTDSASLRRQRYRRRANLWILSGVGALLLTCLISLFVIVRAISDPDLQPWNIHDSANAEEPPNPPPGREPFFDPAAMFGDITVENAQRLVERNPDDPLGYFALAMAEGRADNREGALDTLIYAVQELDASPQLMMSAAVIAQQNDYQSLVVWLHLEILSQPDLSPEARETTGNFLFSQINADPVTTRVLIEQYLTKRAAEPLVLALQAYALLESDPAQNLDEAAQIIDDAYQADDAIAEIYLIRGLIYAEQNQNDRAIDDWRYVLSFADAPEWVTTAARQYLDDNQ